MLQMFQRPDREIERLTAGVALPDVPAELVLAERNFAKLQADKNDAEQHFQFLQENYDRAGLADADGSPIPTDKEALLSAARNVRALEIAWENARRHLDQERRKHGDDVTQAIATGCDAIGDADRRLCAYADVLSECAASSVKRIWSHIDRLGETLH